MKRIYNIVKIAAKEAQRIESQIYDLVDKAIKAELAII